MSHSKDRARANQSIYRNGVRIPRHEWDKQQRLLKEATEDEALNRIGLVRGRANIIVRRR